MVTTRLKCSQAIPYGNLRPASRSPSAHAPQSFGEHERWRLEWRLEWILYHAFSTDDELNASKWQSAGRMPSEFAFKRHSPKDALREFPSTCDSPTDCRPNSHQHNA
jgi:hypothetical protein